jgi:two-component system cell cycle response regulator
VAVTSSGTDCVSSSGSESGRVVIAESQPVVAGALSWLLREQGYAVSAVGDAGELFANIEQAVPDVIVIDSEVVRGDVDLFRRLRAEERWNDIRVILAALEDRATMLPLGADDFVSKPFRVPELLGRVRTQLRARGQLRDARAALHTAAAELERARGDANSNRRLVDILHEVTGDLTAPEIYGILTRRVAAALQISHCSVVLARLGEPTGVVASAAEDPTIHDTQVHLDRYPEIAAAIESQQPVLVEDASTHPLFAVVRDAWSRERRKVVIQSVAAIPFSIDRWRVGALFLRTDRGERRLTSADIEFSEIVVGAAVVAVRRAHALETTRADNLRLEALATTDPLTRVLNRRALLDRLNAEVDRAKRYDSGLTMLLLDVDFFKQINDTAGHLAGDRVLRQLGALLEDAMRKVDVIARYGGEEFVAILPETSTDGGVAFAERLRERIAAHEFDVGRERAVHLTVSIGIATFPSAHVDSTEDLFARADEALYRAKSAGRNQVCI